VESISRVTGHGSSPDRGGDSGRPCGRGGGDAGQLLWTRNDGIGPTSFAAWRGNSYACSQEDRGDERSYAGDAEGGKKDRGDTRCGAHRRRSGSDSLDSGTASMERRSAWRGRRGRARADTAPRLLAPRREEQRWPTLARGCGWRALSHAQSKTGSEARWPTSGI
jgi:hypothetical protein